MSKLKRKRVTVAEESKPERKLEIRGLLDSLRNPGGSSSSRSCSSAEHDRGDGGESWWAAADLTAEEKVWMTLQGFCPEAFGSPASVYCVPELPQSLERAEEERQSEWRWFCLDEEVPELPALKGLQRCAPNHCTKPCAPNNRGLQLPPSPAEQLSQTRHKSQASTSQHPLDDNPKSSDIRQDYQASSSQHLLEDNQQSCSTLRECSEKHNSFREGESQRHGSSLINKSQKSEGGKSARKVKICQGDPKAQTTGHHTSKADQRKVTHLQGEKMLGGESEGRLQFESKSRSLVSKVGSAGGVGSGSGSRVSSLDINADCRAGTSGGGCGAGPAEPKLQCCPMCLMPFPAGFSQMDCDGHLAQCLSEMNMDMVW